MKYILPFLTLLFLFFFFSNTQAQLIRTVAGDDSYGYSGDMGPAGLAQLNWPASVAVDSSGNIYIADMDNNVIRLVEDSSGIISTVAGNSLIGYEGDGSTAEIARLNNPTAVALNRGNFYIADQYNHVIRKVIDTSNLISTFAGNGYEASTGIGGYSGDGGLAVNAEFYLPTSIAFDQVGNLYITDIGNSTVRKVDTAGIITAVVGNGSGTGYSGDGGPATAAKMYQPAGIAVDASGDLYIADQYNNVIRKVNTLGYISTVVGNGYVTDTSTTHAGGYAGDGGQATAAELNGPTGVAFDAAGNLYIADQGNMVVRKVSTFGIITTFAGNGTGGFSGDGGWATLAELNYPRGTTVDQHGNVFIADMNNNVVREVVAGDFPSGINNLKSANDKLHIIRNPNNGSFSLAGSIGNDIDQAATIQVSDALGQVVYKGNIPVQNGNINANISLDGALPDGVYILQAISSNETNTLRFVIQK